MVAVADEPMTEGRRRFELIVAIVGLAVPLRTLVWVSWAARGFGNAR